MKKSNLHLLMSSILFSLIISVLTFGCSARKTQTNIKKTETEKVDVINNQTKTDITENVKKTEKVEDNKSDVTETKSDKVTNETELTVTIEPSADGWSVYDFVIGDKVFKGTTKGTATFTNKAKTDSIKEVKKIEKVTKYVKEKDSIYNIDKKVDAKVDEKHINKKTEKDKDKVSDKKEPVYMTVLMIAGVLAGLFIVYLILKKYKII